MIQELEAALKYIKQMLPERIMLQAENSYSRMTSFVTAINELTPETQAIIRTVFIGGYLHGRADETLDRGIQNDIAGLGTMEFSGKGQCKQCGYPVGFKDL